MMGWQDKLTAEERKMLARAEAALQRAEGLGLTYPWSRARSPARAKTVLQLARSLAASRRCVERLQEKAHGAYEAGEVTKGWLDNFCAVTEADFMEAE